MYAQRRRARKGRLSETLPDDLYDYADGYDYTIDPLPETTPAKRSQRRGKPLRGADGEMLTVIDDWPERVKKPESEVAIMMVPPLIDREIFAAVQARLKSRDPMATPARVTSGPTLLTGICFCAKCGGAMTLRTGRGSASGTYRYYTCSTKARQGQTGCKGRTIPMDRLDHLIADQIEDRLLKPERLEAVLANVLDRRQERTERRREQLAELHKRMAETEQRVGRIYDAIESGLVDNNDSVMKERIVGLNAIRDQARSDAERIEAELNRTGSQAVSPDMIKVFAGRARERMRLENGGYRRDHLRALARRVEVADT